ncbi:UPF0481 protein At3g47200-like [Cucurbita moschata]|uniref:UPF0481 protein At3g47200-like n=1 Tax=Cucurbita moschata TaxID=3662 RepID=A0A6J1HBD2_CUCMO|nr:UPF0481 protein At3g47200-like [Cucurbita moschata]
MAPPNTNEIGEAETEIEREFQIDADPIGSDPGSMYLILQEFASSSSSSNKDVTIHRVLEPLRILNPEAYTPTAISIGPFHSGRKDLKANKFKPMYLQQFLELTSLGLSEIVDIVQNWEEKARRCYAESMEMSKEEFVKLLVLDACFVVMHLISWVYPNFEPKNKENLWQFRNEIYRDLLLLENQLPFFLLQSLYNLFVLSQPLLELSFIQIVHRYYTDHNDREFFFIDINRRQVDHFVDLLRMPKTREYSHEDFSDYLFWPPTATELHECGVIFRTGNDIKFNDKRGCLQLPKISIDDNFENRVRNIIAYEQCHIDSELRNSVTNFTAFMQCLVKSNQDMKLLIEGGIILNYLGGIKEVTQLFSNLGKHVCIGINYYGKDCKEMKTYCKHRRHRWMTSLRRNYFSTPWHCASSIAAILLLALTLIQTILAVVTGFKQTS